MPDPQTDEQFIQRRMLMAAALSALVMGAYIYLAPRPVPPEAPPVEPVAAESAASGAGAEAQPEDSAQPDAAIG